MSLIFGSASKSSTQIQIVKQVAVKKARFEPVSPEDRIAEVFKDILIKPYDHVSARRLLDQLEELIAIVPSIKPDKKMLPLLVRKRVELCALMIDPNPIMIEDKYIPRRDDESKMQLYRLDILTFQLLLAITRLCDTGKHAHLRPIDFRDLVNAGLVADDYAYTYFRSMTMQEVFDCFTTL
jgi:hypothetical protein